VAEADGQHPLQSLWQRKDGPAANQLFLFGASLAGLIPIDRGWVERHVDKIKGSEVNERRGSMFELLGVNLFRKPPKLFVGPKRKCRTLVRVCFYGPIVSSL
jgi:hypothetical protein